MTLTLGACVGDREAGPIEVDGGAGNRGGAEAGADAAVRGDAGPDLPSQKLVFATFQKQSASTLKDPMRICTTELARKGRGPGLAWAQTLDGKSPVDLLGSYEGPWVLPSGKVVFETKEEITKGRGAQEGILETLERTFVSGKAWTALGPDGTPIAANNCSGWTGSTGTTIGTTLGKTGPSWANDESSLSCHDPQHVICFEL